MLKFFSGVKSTIVLTCLVFAAMLFSNETMAQLPALVDQATAQQRVSAELANIDALITSQSLGSYDYEKDLEVMKQYYGLLVEDVTVFDVNEAIFSAYERSVQPMLPSFPGATQLRDATSGLTGTSTVIGYNNAGVSTDQNPYISKAIDLLRL